MNDITQQGQLADIARDYYLGQLTITQLSEKYQLSRYLITKALNEARAAGIVRITINSPIDRNTELETRFAELFPHTNTMIIKDAATTNADIENIIDFAAAEIQRHIKGSEIVGVSWGGTLMNIINRFQTDVRDDLIFTQFMGYNLKYSSAIGATPLVQRAAAKYGSSYLTIPAPLYILNDTVREQLKNEPAMANVFEQCGKMDMLFTGIGTIDSVNSIRVWHQSLNEIFENVDRQEIVGMLYGRPYNIDGQILTPKSDKLFGASVAALLEVPCRIGVVKSKFKARAMLGALRGSLLTDIITNEAVANRVLLELDNN